MSRMVSLFVVRSVTLFLAMAAVRHLCNGHTILCGHHHMDIDYFLLGQCVTFLLFIASEALGYSATEANGVCQFVWLICFKKITIKVENQEPPHDTR